MIQTPSYVYDIDRLRKWIHTIQTLIPGIPLTFSIKANSFVVDAICKDVSHVEVCSPGELHICKTLGINPDQIIYSGVMKEEDDIREAIDYQVDIITAESPHQFHMISSIAAERKKPVKLILRITSDNQFGMDPEDIYTIIRQKEQYPKVHLFGFHYYSGTQKKKPEQTEADIRKILDVVEKCEKEFNYKPELVEYGPGLAVEYFKEENEIVDFSLMQRIAPILLQFAKRVPLGIEMGRFIAAGCGTYYTKVKDIKINYGIQYAILDGGIHHLKYYGQIMAINSPQITKQNPGTGEIRKYCLCGSLCTVADVLAKEAELEELKIDDVLMFHKCGAYSITEASSLFLSRDMPYVYLLENGELSLVRDSVKSSIINCSSKQY